MHITTVASLWESPHAPPHPRYCEDHRRGWSTPLLGCTREGPKAYRCDEELMRSVVTIHTTSTPTALYCPPACHARPRAGSCRRRRPPQENRSSGECREPPGEHGVRDSDSRLVVRSLGFRATLFCRVADARMLGEAGATAVTPTRETSARARHTETVMPCDAVGVQGAARRATGGVQGGGRTWC
jgi:hypothetical protein